MPRYTDNEEKEINELATEIYTLFRSRPMSKALAHRLYEKGWRKVDSVTFVGGVVEQLKADVAREIFSEIGEYAELQIESLNIAEKVDSRGTDFFGGGKQAFVLLLNRLAELKKKYTEGQNNQ